MLDDGAPMFDPRREALAKGVRCLLQRSFPLACRARLRATWISQHFTGKMFEEHGSGGSSADGRTLTVASKAATTAVQTGV